MSRTDKDRPQWVKSNDPQEDRQTYHNHFVFGAVYKSSEFYDECTLEKDDPFHPSTGRDRTENGKKKKKPCYYYYSPKNFWDKVTQEDAHLSFWSPFRAHEKKQLKKLANEYNAHGEIAEDYIFYEKHNHALFGGGYWG